MIARFLVPGMLAVVAVIVFGFWYTHRGYAGTVSEIKSVRAGVLIDLDGRYPGQKMTLYVPRSVAERWREVHPEWPQPGITVTARGAVTQYHGRPEIVINDPGQITW